MPMKTFDFKKKSFVLLIMFSSFTILVSGQQNINVRGTIVDAEEKQPMIGVSVLVEGTDKGTITDFDGNFSLDLVASNAKLVFSYLGYEKKEVPIGNRTLINVELIPITEELDEVVVIGYGAVRKRDLTSSIAKVDDSAIGKTPIMSLDQALQGNAAGVLVINTSSEPGGDVFMRVRGGSSILANNTPLIVVDGFPTDGNDLSALNPNDILSMEVLKDASATAIYGSRGANGVIMVTTKKGSAGAPKVDFSSKIHYSTVRRMIPVLDGPQYETYNNIGRQTMGTSINTLRPDTMPTRDYQRELILPHAVIQDYNLSISGGGEKYSYLLSANVLDQPGLLVNSSFKRTSLRGKFTFEMMKNMNLQLNVSSNNTEKHEVGKGDSGPALRTIMLKPNSNRGTFQDGMFIDEDTGEVLSTDTEISKALNTRNINKNWRNEINAEFSWKFLDHFILRVTGGYRNNQKNTYYYVPNYIYIKQNDLDKNNIAKRGTTTSTKWINENTLTYMNSFNKHNVTAMVGQSWESSVSDGFNGQARGLEDDFEWNNLGGAKIYDSMSSSYSKYNLLSYFGRLIYNYDGRYLTTLTMRADGSSRFGVDSKWGYFPSASFAWVVTEEKFVPKNNTLSTLKMRLSYGLAGNDGIGNYKSWSTLGASGIVVDGNPIKGYTANNIGDPMLSWEETATANVGFDLGLFKNRVFLTVDLYNKRTNNLLYDYRLPNTTGYQKVATNIGEILNQGIEIEFSSENFAKKNFKWNTSLNVGYNKGKITDLGGDNDLIAYQMTSTVNTPITYLIVGEPIGTFKGHQTAGVYKDWNDVYNSASVWYNGTLEARTQPGYPKYVDRHEDGVIDEFDKVILGHAQPDWTLGFTNTFTIYKNWELSVFFNGVFGNSIVNTNKGKLERYRGSSDNQTRYVMDGYRVFDPLTGSPGYYSGERPRAIYVSSSNTAHADYAQNLTDLLVEDGSYLRLKTLSLAYNIPQSVLQKIKLRTFRIQLSGVNLFTWTKYTGMDPEASSSMGDSNTSLGIDQSSYPASRSWVVSLNIGL